jgi:hypothetical protein
MDSLFLALFLTQIIELPLAYFLGLRKIELVGVFFINIFTNPLANLFFWLYGQQIDYWLLIFIIEFFVFIIEFLLILFVLKKGGGKSIFISFIINLSSFLFGLLLNL